MPSADWPGLSWPLQGAAIVSSGAGQIALQGRADDYRLELRTMISGEGIPASDIDLVAAGDQQGLRLQPLKVGVLDGRLQAEGEVRWGRGLVWDLKLLVEQINPGLYLSDWPGNLGGRMDLAGGLAAEGGELCVRGRMETGVWERRLCVEPTAAAEGRGEIVSYFGRQAVEDLEMRLAAGAHSAIRSTGTPSLPFSRAASTRFSSSMGR